MIWNITIVDGRDSYSQFKVFADTALDAVMNWAKNYSEAKTHQALRNGETVIVSVSTNWKKNEKAVDYCVKARSVMHYEIGEIEYPEEGG